MGDRSVNGFAPADASQPRYTGFQTLLRADHRTELDELDIALIGVPSDFPVYINGTRFGPAQVREASRMTRLVDYASRLEPFKLCRVADIGDAPVDPLDLKHQNELIQDYFRPLVAREIATLAVGGDHGITLPILRAMGSRHRGLGLLQVDAHSDTFDEYLGSSENHTTVTRRAIEEGVLDPARVAIVGLRNTLYSPDQLDWAEAQGVTIISADDVLDMGPAAAAEKARAAVGDGPMYLTLDVDGLDPSEAPGTGVREPGGLRYRDVSAIVRGLWGRPILGADVVEVCPPLDRSGRTAMVAAGLAFQALCAIAVGISGSGAGSTAAPPRAGN